VAGTTYTFHFATMGSADIHMCVFENAGGGAFFGNRVGAALETSHCATYTPTVTGWHGVAVVCDWGEGTYELGVTTGACTCPAELADGVPVDVPGDYYGTTSLFAMPQTAFTWSAIGVLYDGTLPASYLETYLEPYGSSAPDCLSGLLADDYGVNGGRNWQVLAADFNENYPRTDYALVYAEADVRAEWEQSQGFLYLNEMPHYASFAAGDVLDVYEIYLQAGHGYWGKIQSAGNGARMRVYAPSAGAPFGPTLLLDVATNGEFTAPTTGWYGVAVLNVPATSYTYGIEFRGCKAIVGLTSDSPQAMFGWEARYSFAQSENYWAAVGLHNFSADFDVWVGSGTSETNGDCVTGILCSSLAGDIDYVIGDFNHDARTTYYVNVMSGQGFSHGETSVEWDAGVDQILTNGSRVQGTWTSADVLDVYDVYLLAGKTYAFHLSGANAELDFFRDTGVPFWTTRYEATFDLTSGGTYNYTAPATDYYGVVILHLDALPGTYSTWVYPVGVDVEDGPPLVTGLTSLEPNPARGPVRVQYSLRERASVGFRVFDMAGREVWRTEPEAREAGRWSAEWVGADASGRRLAPGLYFLHMLVDDRPIAQRKITLLR
jgi:hypothetical protein